MADLTNEEPALYNLDGGQRHLVLRGGVVKAVAPGLRLVGATDAERQRFEAAHPKPEEPYEYGLPG